MRITLQFDHEEDARCAMDGERWRGVCNDLQQWLRSEEKYAGKQELRVEDVRDRLLGLMDEAGLRLDS